MAEKIEQKMKKDMPLPSKNGKNGKKTKVWGVAIELNLKNIFIGLFLLFVVFALFGGVINPDSLLQETSLSTVMKQVKEGKVKHIDVEDTKLIIRYTNGDKAISHKEGQDSIYRVFDAAGVDPKKTEITVKDTTGALVWINFLTNMVPLVLIGLVLLFVFRQARGAQDNLFSFGQSKARIWNKDLPKTTFNDVAGVDEAKKELAEIVDFLKNPAKYKALGARTPKGVILIGPSGTGKTLLAKAMAGEAHTAFYSIAGSEFMEMLVGVGAARARDLFAQAKKNAPAIIFIDEIDAIGRMRSVSVMGGHDEREQTLNQILVEMDGFEPNTAVLIVAATNRGDLLDPALMRPGRFDRRVILSLPDLEGRKATLAIHAKGKPFAPGVDWERIARRTVGFSGADIENMLNEAAINAANLNKTQIDMRDLEEAATKVKLGPEKKRLQTELDRKMTAYHEAGHALVTYLLPHMDQVHRISIISRGQALGYTLTPPEKDRLHETKSHLIEQMATMMGGRAAEQLIFKELTSGASNDIDQATRIAKYMVMEFGMSDLGPINFGPQTDITDYRAGVEGNSISPDMQAKIDMEVKKILDTAYATALSILKKNRKKLDKIAKELVARETIETDEFEKLMGGPKKRVH